MRIDGKRASYYSNNEITFMLRHGKDFAGRNIDDDQRKELTKTLRIRDKK